MRPLLPLLVLLCACDEWEPMQLQQRPDVYRASTVFEDGRAMRPMVPNTVAQETWRAAAGLRNAGSLDAGYVEALPLTFTRELANEGHQQFDIFCAACHGLLGDGKSVVASKMTLRPPPNLLVPREEGRTLTSGELPRPLGFYFTVITDGYGLMPSYADTLNPRQRWAVVAYLKGLALSQRAPLALAPPDIQQRLAREAP